MLSGGLGPEGGRLEKPQDQRLTNIRCLAYSHSHTTSRRSISPGQLDRGFFMLAT